MRNPQYDPNQRGGRLKALLASGLVVGISAAGILFAGRLPPAADQLARPPLYTQWQAVGIRATDGDTLTVQTEGKQFTIRLAGVDCPERGQPFGAQAQAFTQAATVGQRLTMTTLAVDRYQRQVATCTLPDGKDMSESLAFAGMAHFFPQYPGPNKRLPGLMATAQAARRGLWSQSHTVPPWDWRKGVR